MKKGLFWKGWIICAILCLMMGMTVFAEEDDLTLVEVSETQESDGLVMAGGHGTIQPNPTMYGLVGSNNTRIKLLFDVRSFGDSNDYYEILIYRGTETSAANMVSRKVSSFDEQIGTSTYTFEWNTTDVGKYPAGTYTIVCTAYYYSDLGNAVSNTDSLEVVLEDYRLIQDRAFVERLYNKVFMRSADADGLTYWSERLFNGITAGADVIVGFVNSPEFVNKNTSNREYLEVLYRAIFDREAAEEELEYWLNVLDGGVSRNFVLKGFTDSPEFSRLCTSYSINQGTVTLTEVRDLNPQIAGFVNRLYKLTLQRDDDGSGINYWVDILVKKTQTPQVVAHGFVFSPELLNKNLSDEEYVRILYRAMMDREGEDAGVNYYLEHMKKGMTRESVFGGFANSPEFTGIIASYGL